MTFDITPVPASRPRVTRWGVYYGKKYTQFKKDMSYLLAKTWWRSKPIIQPLELDVVFYMPIRGSISRSKRRLLHETYCVSNMDLDNLEKALYDSMNGIVYADDKQIVCHHTKKVWIDGKGKIDVIIKPLENGQVGVCKNK